MADNSWKKRVNIVYSTNPGYNYQTEESDTEETLPPSRQKLRVSLDSKGRNGKTVTLVTGFAGSDDDLKTLCKELKGKCGVGGSAKDGEIIIQGKFKERVCSLLIAMGYAQTKMK